MLVDDLILKLNKFKGLDIMFHNHKIRFEFERICLEGQVCGQTCIIVLKEKNETPLFWR